MKKSRSHIKALPVFSETEFKQAKLLLATKVTQMMGRKLEEGDWGEVYSLAKNIPLAGWSNLHIDINYNGLGVEHKLLRCSGLNGRPIKSVCGTTMMHPAATRSIRISDTTQPAEKAMIEVFRQYAELIELRRQKVATAASNKKPDMRTGWLLWEDSLSEFLYFEEALQAPLPEHFYAEWNETTAKGARKSSKSLWIFEKDTDKKRFSVTTSAGVKIQPYFDVPPPSDPNLYYFRVQGERIGSDTIQIWVAASTAKLLKQTIGSLDKIAVSEAIVKLASQLTEQSILPSSKNELAIPVQLTADAYEILTKTWEGVSDEHRAQLLLKSLELNLS
ncbi:MAG: hypothetical protein KIS77_04050 [Saprospiraceae bacterium]|nr:hypothetical protein [Saprospiraceae bacterium]